MWNPHTNYCCRFFFYSKKNKTSHFLSVFSFLCFSSPTLFFLSFSSLFLFSLSLFGPTLSSASGMFIARSPLEHPVPCLTPQDSEEPCEVTRSSSMGYLCKWGHSYWKQHCWTCHVKLARRKFTNMKCSWALLQSLALKKLDVRLFSATSIKDWKAHLTTYLATLSMFLQTRISATYPSSPLWSVWMNNHLALVPKLKPCHF